MENFKNGMLSLFKRNFGEIKRMVDSIDFDEFEKGLEENFNTYKKSISEKFNELKSKVNIKNGKYTIVVPYDRDNQIMSFSVKDDEEKVFTVDIKSCEDCGNTDTKSTFSSVTTLPANVLIDEIKQVYNEETKIMTFEFESVDNENSNNGIDYSTETETLFTEDDNEDDSENVSEDDTVRESNHQALVNRMIEMHNNGQSFRQIAREVGLSDKTVARWIRKGL